MVRSLLSKLLTSGETAIPLGLVLLAIPLCYALAFAPTPWPFFALYADLALLFAPPFEGFYLVVFVVDFLALLGWFLLGRRLAAALAPRMARPWRQAAAFTAAAVLILVAFWLYPVAKGAFNAARFGAPEEDAALAFFHMSWRDDHTTHGVVATTRESPSPLWLGIRTLRPEETLHIRLEPEQMRRLYRLLRRHGYFRLPHRVDVLPSMDHHLFGISWFADGRQRHVLAKLSSDAWEEFEEVREALFQALHLPEDGSWEQAVPAIRNGRGVSLGDG